MIYITFTGVNVFQARPWTSYARNHLRGLQPPAEEAQRVMGIAFKPVAYSLLGYSVETHGLGVLFSSSFGFGAPKLNTFSLVK